MLLLAVGVVEAGVEQGQAAAKHLALSCRGPPGAVEPHHADPGAPSLGVMAGLQLGDHHTIAHARSVPVSRVSPPLFPTSQALGAFGGGPRNRLPGHGRPFAWPPTAVPDLLYPSVAEGLSMQPCSGGLDGSDVPPRTTLPTG